VKVTTNNLSLNKKQLREKLREKGQFWTPDWIALAMVRYLIQDDNVSVFDPAVGNGAFYQATQALSSKLGKHLDFSGTEIDPSALNFLDISHTLVQIRDFVNNPPAAKYSGIVGNPPYIRHHRLTEEVKSSLKTFCQTFTGMTIDGRAGLHVYFLLRALQLLKEGGRLAFILPSDTFEGVFAFNLWQWILKKYNLEAVITFSASATPFPNVDTNPVIVLLKNTEPLSYFYWARCEVAHNYQLENWVASKFRSSFTPDILFELRMVDEALKTGLSRQPFTTQTEGYFLGSFAKVVRGVATGANDFFFFNSKQVTDLDLPRSFLKPAIGRTRDIENDVITPDTLKRLEEIGRPTLLLSLDNRPREAFPTSIQNYLDKGEEQGVHLQPLVSSRRPWYKMEFRKIPPILFAYLGRRNSRFIKNVAGVIPLTGFLCVYPIREDEDFLLNLFSVLQNPTVLENLTLVGKSYGGGAIKVEPRALEKLFIPKEVADNFNLRPIQNTLF
jgi:hypothetical protein